MEALPAKKKGAINVAGYRLGKGGVLETEQILAQGLLWVPVIPATAMPFISPEVGWQRWLFDQHHKTFLNPHRPFAATLHLLKRTGWWSTMAGDCHRWYLECRVCLQFRATATRPPTRSMLGSDEAMETLPWEDVVIDVQGPFTRSDEDCQYILSYHCTRLKAAP